jgi:GNAT superfamily N-acetyltransferase
VSIVNKVWQSLHNQGPLRTVQRSFQRLMPAAVFDVNTIVGVETSLRPILEDWTGTPKNEALLHRWATEDDIDHLTRGGLSPHDVRSFFDLGGIAAITTKDGNPVGYFWLFPTTKIYYSWLQLSAEPGGILGGHIYVAPEYRGERWFREVRKFVFPQLLDQGYERMLGFIDSLNRSSLRAGASQERRNIGRIFYLHCLGFVIFRINHIWRCGRYSEKQPFLFSFEGFRR